MHRHRLMLLAILAAILIVGLDIENAIYHPESIAEPPEEILPLVDSRDLLQRALSEDPPRTPVDLRSLVIELQNATPIVNRTDYDNDLLYDPVERVIGTDPTRNDTDSDTISDYFEAMNGTDPLLPDSNFDGIYDFDEVNVTLDLDEDGIPNAWDFDNDGDGVNDDPDLSPFACSNVMSSFDMHIQTDGKPTYINIQLTPADVSHLKLFYQTWNWPLDYEGLMQDHDDSQEDITINPYLRIWTYQIPTQDALDEMNVITSENQLLVRLFPVLEYGSIVAFNGRLLYNGSVPSNIDLRAELLWRVDGLSDITAKVLKGDDYYLEDDYYVSHDQDMIAVCNVSDSANALPLELIEIRDTADTMRFALKIFNGPYLSVASDGRTLVFNASSIGTREIFELYKYQGWIMGFNKEFIHLNPDGTLVLQTYGRLVVEFEDQVFTSSTHLVSYTEPFRITGITIEEYYDTDVGIFYNTTSMNYTIAASWFMTYRFVNNATTTLSEMPGLLANQNVNVSNSILSVRDKYTAVMELCNNLVPSVLDDLPSSQHVPILMAIEDRSKVLDLSQTLSGTYRLQESCLFNLTEFKVLTMKSLKMNWYNSTTKVALAPIELPVKVAQLDLSEMASINLLAVLLRWDNGIQQITKIGSDLEQYDGPDSEELDIVQYVLMGGLELINLGNELVFGLKAWKELNIYINNIGSVAEVSSRLQLIKQRFAAGSDWVDLVKDIGKSDQFCTWLKYTHWINANRNTKALKVFKNIGKVLFVLGIIVDLGLSIAAGFIIADQIGGQTGREYGTIYGITAAVIGLIIVALLAVIETIPVVGWLIALAVCIADVIGGFSSDFIMFLTKLFFGTPNAIGSTSPNAYLAEAPDISIIDFQQNGLTLGDWLRIDGTIIRQIEATVKEGFYLRFGRTVSKENIGKALILNSILNPFVTYHRPDGGFEWFGNLLFVDSQETFRQTSTYPYKILSTIERVFASIVIPTMAMNNYPITMKLSYPYIMRNSWKHYVYPWFGLGGDCYHDDTYANLTACYDAVTFYYDVFPNNLKAFLSWSVITANDPDGDQLLQDEETANGVSPWNYDSDGDNLNDRYELDKGLDATKPDSDMDGVSDWYEHVYGTNGTNSDSDEDGVSDFDEISGWIINFCYLDNDSLRFQIPVTSDPRSNDSDGDGIDDFEEFKSNTNPRSNDTNGDGIPDLSFDWYVSEATYETAIDITLDGEYNQLTDICVDKYGFVYTGGYIAGITYNAAVRKFDSSLNPAILPPSSVFPNMTAYPLTSTQIVEIDNTNNWLYVQTESGIDRFNLSGTETNPGSWSTLSLTFIRDIDFDDSGNIYILRAYYSASVAEVRKYSSTGTLLATWGSYGSAVNQFDYPGAITIDNKLGFIYICDSQQSFSKPERIVKLRLSDGAFLGTVSEGYDKILDVDIDDDGCLYVLGENSSETTVQKFRPNGEEDVDFRFNGNGTDDFYAPNGRYRHLAVGPDKSIYVLDWVVVATPFTSRIWKFSQNIELSSDLVPSTDADWDNDGLTNAQEIDGWEITVNFTTGEQTFLVTSNHLMNDTDLDGLGDYLEYTLGSNPRVPDSDGDGASDHLEWWETTYPSVPYVPPMGKPVMAPSAAPPNMMGWTAAGPSLTDWDSDGDMLGDGIELTFGSSPVNPDSDAEGLSDLNEFIYSSNPNSADSDNDGADDAYELAMNSSLLNPDSDGDNVLDGTEYSLGLNVTNADQDGDGILDGIEVIYGSNPLSSDSDGDGISDAVEVSLWLDLLSNDTDGDGVLDGIEIAQGTDPWLTDSDWDGVADDEDPDTLNPWGGHVAIVYDADASNATIAFAELFGNYSQVTVFDADDFLDVSEDFTYIVLIGRPSSSATGTAGLVYHLLEGTGSMLTTMMDIETDNIAVRYGVWMNPQTVVLMSGANTTDVFTVLQTMKYFEVSLLPDSVLVEFAAFDSGHNISVDYAFPVNTIDTVKTVDAAMLIQLSGPATPYVQITRYNHTTTPHALTITTGLEDGDTALGRYLDVSLTIAGATQDVFESALLVIYYRASDLDLNANGILGDIGDINESTLSVYHFDEIREEWMKITDELNWVIGMGQNTTDISVFGENYAGYIWMQVTDLSMFAIAGQTIHVGFGFFETVIVIAIVGTSALVAIVVVRQWRKRRIDDKHMDLLSSLQACLGWI